MNTASIRELLQLNPIWQSPEILRRRRELLPGDAAAVTVADPLTSARWSRRADRVLQTVQQQFFDLDEEQLDRAISFLGNENLPQYAARVARLKRAAEHRDMLRGIAAQTGDAKFAYSLIHGLIGPAGQAGSLREQYVEAIIAEQRVGPACETIARLVENHPTLRQLDPDWFDVLLDPHGQRRWRAKHSYWTRFRKHPMTKFVVIPLVVSTVMLIWALLADARR